MFNKKTILILGAGASWHMGYPTGNTLIKKMVETQYCPEEPKFTIQNKKISTKVEEFVALLRDMEPLMIDTFLSYHNDCQNIGKEILTYELLNIREDHMDRVFGRNSKSWYRYIVNSLITGCKEPEDILENNRNLTVVTFNYDISLEYYLLDRLKKIDFFKNVVDEFISELKIIHVYGQLQKFKKLKEFSWDLKEISDDRDNALALQYFYTDLKSYYDTKTGQNFCYNNSGNSIGAKAIAKEVVPLLKNNIEIIGNNKWNDIENERIQKIRDELSSDEAKNVYALGFGFHDANMQLIELDKYIKRLENPQGNKFYYTNMGDSEKINRKVFKQISRDWLAEDVVVKSTRSIDDALALDFDLTE